MPSFSNSIRTSYLYDGPIRLVSFNMYVSLPGIPAHKKNDIVVSSGNEEELTKFIEDIRILTYEKLQEMGTIVNNQWKKSKNMNSGEVDIDKESNTFIPSGVDSNMDKYSLN